MRKNSFNYCVPRGSSTNLVKFVVYNKIFVFIYLWLVGVEHFQSLVEIIDDGLAPRIGALNNDTYVVVGVFVAYATEKDGELLGMVVLLKPALKKQAALALPPVAGVADVENDRGIDTEELDEYCHHGLFDLGVALGPDMPHVVDVKLIGVAVPDGRIFLELYLVEHIIVSLKQVDAVCDLLNRVRAVGLDA